MVLVLVLIVAVTEPLRSKIGHLFSQAWLWVDQPRTPEWWGAAGQWAGALGTFGAVVVALWIAMRDGRRAQQDRERLTEQEHRSHVARLAAWFGEPIELRDDGQLMATVDVSNTSDEPFYEVVVFPVFIQGAAPHTGEELARGSDGYPPCVVIAALLPGRWIVETPGLDSVPSGSFGIEIACRDRFGTNWIRRATGELVEMPTNPVDHYKLSRPLKYAHPTRAKD
ncbi:hypothetical protein [Amycolatopsis taiwanensis]|uniref:hypothetical protein n=1 Tax=Amycolatopsis taiwanensis TaxID=342230 RepID=UPI0025562314|nr:hypothetical protein [Amycolatopsis taiwanensis]